MTFRLDYAPVLYRIFRSLRVDGVHWSGAMLTALAFIGGSPPQRRF